VNRRDEELLARQLRHASTIPGDRWLGPGMLAIFLLGFLLGGSLLTRPEAPRSADVMASITAPGAPAVIRR
jgi:hypothetical protein